MIRLPPSTPYIALTDDATGEVYVLRHLTAPTPRVKITPITDLPLRWRLQRLLYAAFEGPAIDGGRGRLEMFVRSGRLGCRIRSLDRATSDRDNASVYTRVTQDPTGFPITAGDETGDGRGHLGFEA